VEGADAGSARGLRVSYIAEQVANARSLECIEALGLLGEMGLRQVPDDMLELAKRVLSWGEEERKRACRNDVRLADSSPLPSRMDFLEIGS
jgi:hypothetical protein